MTSDRSDFKQATQNLWDLHVALEGDLDHWAKIVFRKGSSSQLARRSYIRALFATIEGQIYGLKRIALAIHVLEKKHLPPDDVLLLREEVPELTDGGKTKPRSAFLKFRPNLRFAFRALAEVLGAAHELNANGKGWAALDSSVGVRDRLMHPKNVADLHVTDKEIASAGSAHIWFNGEFAALFKAAAHAREDEIKDLEAGAGRE